MKALVKGCGLLKEVKAGANFKLEFHEARKNRGPNELSPSFGVRRNGQDHENIDFNSMASTRL